LDLDGVPTTPRLTTILGSLTCRRFTPCELVPVAMVGADLQLSDFKKSANFTTLRSVNGLFSARSSNPTRIFSVSAPLLRTIGSSLDVSASRMTFNLVMPKLTSVRALDLHLWGTEASLELTSLSTIGAGGVTLQQVSRTNMARVMSILLNTTSIGGSVRVLRPHSSWPLCQTIKDHVDRVSPANANHKFEAAVVIATC